jgi:hypothetical protein
MMKLYRLIYASDVAEYIDWTDLKDILLKSQENNEQLGITGLLVMASGKFLQALEGPSDALNALYRKILRDSRHQNSRIVSYTAIHDRHFGEWSMRGINATMMKPELKALLIKKYGAASDGDVVVPEDSFLSYSFLYDIYVDAKP